jgi:hypothetical protein
VSAYPWSHGVFGFVKSPKAGRCADHRRVVVLKQRGHGRQPRKDERVAADRTHLTHGFYEWSARTGRAGSFYAKASMSRGCRVGLSQTVKPRPIGSGEGGGTGNVPQCNPYLGEGPSSVCRFDEVHVVGNDHCHADFTSTQGVCRGAAVSGPFPWGTGGGRRTQPYAEFDWNRNQNEFLYVAYDRDPLSYDIPGMAHLGGKMPGPSSNAFTVTDGFAQNNSGYPNGPHFYTPDIPGQDPGDEGGPLNFKYESRGQAPLVSADIYIKGFLYLKR